MTQKTGKCELFSLGSHVREIDYFTSQMHANRCVFRRLSHRRQVSVHCPVEVR